MGQSRRRYGWTTPRWKDSHFWAAVVITAVLVALQVVTSARASWADWGSIVLRSIVVWVLLSAVLKIRRGMPQALVDGYTEAEEKARAKPSGQSTGESIAKSSGRAVGRAIAAYKRANPKD
jgi:hypothetical protein